MATAFKNKITPNVGISPTEIVSMASTARATVIGMSLANKTADPVTVSITITDASVIPSVLGYYMKDIIIPANQTLRAVNGGERLLIAPENVVHVVANVASAIDSIVSYVEIT
jgi:hypothetical protein